MIEDDMRRIGQNWSNTIFASASYKTLKLTYNGQIISDSNNWGLSSGTLGNFTNSYNMLSPVGYHNIALRYTTSFGMTIGATIRAIQKTARSRCLRTRTICLVL